LMWTRHSPCDRVGSRARLCGGAWLRKAVVRKMHFGSAGQLRQGGCHDPT